MLADGIERGLMLLELMGQCLIGYLQRTDRLAVLR